MRSLYILLHWPMINLILLISLNGLSRQFASSLPEEHIMNITGVLNNVMDGFLNVATNAINTKRDTMAVIILTLKDYTDECQIHLKPYLFNKLMVAMLEHKNRTHD